MNGDTTFFQFFDHVRIITPLHLDIYYSKNLDYVVKIWKKGYNEDGSDLEICNVQSFDIDYALTKAKLMLMDYMLNKDPAGGY